MAKRIVVSILSLFVFFGAVYANADSPDVSQIQKFCQLAGEEDAAAKIENLGGINGNTTMHEADQAYAVIGFRLTEDPSGIRYDWKEHDIYIIIDKGSGKPAYLNISYKEYRGGYTVDTQCCTHWIIEVGLDGRLRQFNKDLEIKVDGQFVAPRYPADITEILDDWRKPSVEELNNIVKEELIYWIGKMQ